MERYRASLIFEATKRDTCGIIKDYACSHDTPEIVLKFRWLLTDTNNNYIYDIIKFVQSEKISIIDKWNIRRGIIPDTKTDTKKPIGNTPPVMPATNNAVYSDPQAAEQYYYETMAKIRHTTVEAIKQEVATSNEESRNKQSSKETMS